MHRFLRQRSFDIVHLNTALLIGEGVGARWAKTKVAWHVREQLYRGLLGLRYEAVRGIIASCSEAIIAISNCVATPWDGHPGVRVVYNFVDFGQFDRRISGEGFRRAASIPPDRPIVLMLGGVVASKGADILVEAASRIHRRRPEIHFVIAGYSPTASHSSSAVKRVLRRLAEGVRLVPNMGNRVARQMDLHGLASHVHFVGPRRDIPELLAACSVVVWPATVAHFARPIIEAGAMARPVVASDFRATREIVESGATGRLVPPGDARALAGAIVDLIEHPVEARAMGERAYAIARERYDARRNAAEVFGIYDRMLGALPTCAEAG
jgi:glycosyltransferase involved in cell wall biosynthesis